MGVLDKVSKKPGKKKQLSYKERNGTTRVGDALRWLGEKGAKISPVLLDLAGTATGIKEFKELGNMIRGEESLTEEDKRMLLKQMEHDMIEMQEVTKRLEIDKDHTITRLVRPVVYGSMFILFMSIVLFDGNLANGFSINEVYIPVIESLFSTMTVFYFGSRGLEKVVRKLKE